MREEKKRMTKRTMAMRNAGSVASWLEAVC
jgi:hypothetical protein